jgi:hypothetical protein
VKNRRIAAAGALSLALVLGMSFAPAAYAQTFVGEPSDWSFVGAPVVTTLGVQQAAQVTLDNHLEVSVLGIVILVLRNNLGQTVDFTTGTITLTTGLGAYGTVYLVVGGVQPGMYNATIFAFTLAGVAISNSTTVPFAAS